MTHPAVIKTTQLILAGDLLGAEKALAQVAETEGDTALVALLDQVAPKDLLAIMREFDGASESIVNLLVTPEQFVEAVVLEKKYGEKGHDRLRGMMNAILYRDDALTSEYLEAIGEKEEGMDVLVNYFADRVEEVLTFAMTAELGNDVCLPETMDAKSIEWLRGMIADVDGVLHEDESILTARSKTPRAEVADHDWMETACVLRDELNDLFVQLIIAIRDRLGYRLESLNTLAPAPVPAAPATGDDEESAI
ncbi:hypothetical protein [Craterilacuibacter sp.]|uniref:hypothetical protein n=1 Tax=Craterilacuibacter sp. TaxID=2870909 RepID=UPI003F332CBD